MQLFLMTSLFPFFAIFLAIKGMLYGIELGGGKKLSRRATLVVGLFTIAACWIVIAVAYAQFILGMTIL